MAGFEGLMGSFDEAMRNPAILNVMATLAQGVSPKGTAGQALGALSSQMIRTKSKANLLQKLLGGGDEEGGLGLTGEDVLQMPESMGGGFMSGNAPSSLSGKGKLTMSEDGKINISGDENYIRNISGIGGRQGGGQITPQMSSQAPIQNPTSQPNNSAQAKYANPFASSQPSLTTADLAGLTSEDINQAVTLMLGNRELGRKTTSDIYDATYKMGILGTQQKDAETKRLTEQRASAPFIGGYNKSEFKSLPSDEQEYTVYKSSEESQSRSPVSRREFKMMEPTVKEKFLRSALKDPALKGIAKELAQAGVTPLKDKVAEKSAFADVKSKKYFTSPNGLSKDVNKYMSSEEVGNKKFMLGGDEDKISKFIDSEKSSFIADKITSGGGEIVGRRKEGSTRIWDVKWSDGTTSEVRYGF